MTGTTLVTSGVINVVAAGVLMYVGYRLGKRGVTGEGRLAATAFSVWWWGAGLYGLGAGTMSLLAAAGVTPLPVFIANRYLNLVVFSVAAWGLMYYLVYLVTGWRRAWLPLAVAYGGLCIVLVAHVATSNPVGVEVMRWRTDLVYETPLGSGFRALLFAAAVPPILGALAYLSLYARVEEPTLKYRVLLVSGSLIIWILASLLARLAEDDWWQLLTRGVLNVVAALIVLAAYHPPAPFQRWFGVTSLSKEVDA